MARLNKSRARSSLAESNLSLSWGSGLSGLHDDSRYSLRVNNDTHSYSLDMKPKEVNSFINFYAGRETPIGGVSWGLDKRTLPERLRALADKLEAEGELQRMELTG